MNLHVYGRHTSYNVQKVLWLVDELGLVYGHTETGGRHGGNDQPGFLAMNPMGKVPVLTHGKNSIWESHTILRYLADSFGKNSWSVNDAFQRSCYERWMDWSQTKFEVAFVGVFWGYYRTPPELRDQAAIGQSVQDCHTCLDLLSNQLTDQDYLLGSDISLADVSTSVYLHRLSQIDLEIQFPRNIQDWYARLAARAGYAKWVMSDFSDLEGRLSY